LIFPFQNVIYVGNLFTIKDTRFKSKNFLEEVKRSYTNLVNIYVKDDKERLQVFDKSGIYLPTKKIGKNNPRAEQMEADNEMRKKWNQTVDRALVSGVPETQIMNVKQTEISVKARESVKQFGRQPQLFAAIILLAVVALELLITQIFKLACQQADRRNAKIEPIKEISLEETTTPEKPKKTPLAAKYLRLSEIYNKLENQNYAIYQREQQLSGLEQELLKTKGIFKGKERKELQGQIDQLKPQIESMKRYLPSIVQEYGYKTVKEFLVAYSTAKTENAAYEKATANWEKKYGTKAESDSIKARLEYHKQQMKKRENSRQRTYHYSADRGAR